MKLFKSLLLGSAAGLVAVSGASAADLGVRKPAAAVEYVRVCSAHGAGFWYIPGSDVCIKIGGRVRAEYLYASGGSRGDDRSSFRANGRLEADLRQTTDYGLLRAFVRYDVYADGGRYAGTTNGAIGVNQFGNAQNTNALLDKAFIQFYTGSAGFITAGRSASFFDFYANNDNWTRLPGSDRGSTNLFAYTFTFGGGLTATLSVEDQYARRLTGVAFVNAINPNTGLPFAVPVATAGQALNYSGQRIPDVVANVRIDQAWGSAQLSGAVHQMYVANLTTAGNGFIGNKYGWAIQGGLKLNLPMIAAGDTFWLQAAYSKGATDYAGVSRYAGDAAALGFFRTAVASADGYVLNGSIRQATSWSVVASFVHNFTPTIQGAVFGGYGVVNYPGSTALNGFNDYKAYAVGGQLSWLPVRGFRIGTEVMYNRIDPEGTVALTRAIAGGIATDRKSAYNSWTARVRFQRDF